MINKYCYVCGNEMYGNTPCSKCGAHAIEMPESKRQLEATLGMLALQEENKPKKGTGCIVMMIAVFIMFGIPAIFMFLGDGIISYSIVSIVLLFVNIKLFKYRKNMTFQKKKKYFNLRKESEADFSEYEDLCLKCRQLLTEDMTHCPSCGRPAGQDIPIQLGLKRSSVSKKSLPKVSEEKDINAKLSHARFCSKCGSNVENQKFCTECGSKVEVR